MKKYKAFLFIPLILAAAIIFFFLHFGLNDARVLADFPVAYQKYDQAVSDYSKAVLASNQTSAPATNDLERKANEALAALRTKASARISSLTLHDGEIMRTTLEIGDLSGKEFDTLKLYQKAAAGKNANLDQLAKEIIDFKNKRQTDYARFQELAGLNK